MHTHNHNNHNNNDSCIWGVELNSSYSPAEVRDAMIRCFAEANGEFIAEAAGLELPKDKEKRNKKIEKLTRDFVRRAFAESGGDFDAPTKKSILAALERLKEYAKNHQHPEMISKHAAEMRRLAEGLKK